MPWLRLNPHVVHRDVESGESKTRRIGQWMLSSLDTNQSGKGRSRFEGLGERSSVNLSHRLAEVPRKLSSTERGRGRRGKRVSIVNNPEVAASIRRLSMVAAKPPPSIRRMSTIIPSPPRTRRSSSVSPRLESTAAEDHKGKLNADVRGAVDDDDLGRWNRRASILMEERKSSQRKMRLGRRSRSQKAAVLELDKTRAEAELLERHRMKQLTTEEMEDEALGSAGAGTGKKDNEETRWSAKRKCHSAKDVSEIHGYLSDQDVGRLMKATNYTRRELFYLFVRFKALCSLSPTPEGIDKETFRKAVPLLSVEDDLFVDRVFEVLDEDGSECIEWAEFLEAMSALEKGTRECRTAFLFKVYDQDHDGGISKDELYKFFLSSLMVSVDDNIRSVSEYFVNKVFSEIDVDADGKMTVEEALKYIEDHPEVKDIYGSELVGQRLLE